MTVRLIRQDDVLLLSGVVTFANAKSLYQQGLPLLAVNLPPTVLDLSQLSQSNTIVLAVIVQWLRQLKPTQSLQLQQVPDKLQAIMRASNLERLLPV
ncbi:MAG: STAS domain-containing protein [Moraxellaceae bacterium]